MPLFTSSREKRLWCWVLAVLVAIFSTLFIGQPLVQLFSNQDIQAVFFVLGMVLVAATIIVHGFQTKPSKIEWTLLLGIIAVYQMLFLRLGLSERSHLIEYSVLAIFIHKALTERKNLDRQILNPALLTLVMAFLIGVIDECIQMVLPNRVFDPADIFFNGMAITMAIGARLLLTWIRKLSKKDT